MLSEVAEQYIRLRRIGGFKFDVPALLVRSFARFATVRGDSHIETRTVIDWAAHGRSPEAREVRLQVIVAFARHCRAEDVAHEVPPAGVFGKGYSRRPIAYIFSPEEIERLLAGALALQPKASLRPYTSYVLFGLLAATGLRLGEALRLRFGDLTPEGLVIRETKFRKTRLVPLHPTTTQALQRYIKLRTLLGGHDDHIFVGLNGQRLRIGTAQTTFREVAKATGLDAVSRKRRPRLHDLRHTWAVRALESSPRARPDRPSHARRHGLPRARKGRVWLLVSPCHTVLDETDRRRLRHARAGGAMTPLAPHLTAFLRERLPVQRCASQHTCDTYAYAFQLLLTFASQRLGKRPSELSLEEVDVPLISDFLVHLQTVRRNGPRTRNARLAAIKSFMHFLEHRVPSAIEQLRRVLAIPSQRCDRSLVRHLTIDEERALLDAPDPSTRIGIRDRAMLHVALAGGLRVSELIGIRMDDLSFDGPYVDVLVRGKGRKARQLRLWKRVGNSIRAWLAVRGNATVPEVFVNAQGRHMTRAGFEYVLDRCKATATRRCPSLSKRSLSPHVLRHTCALRVLKATGDIRQVALWLGHASTTTTEIYLELDPLEKLQAVAGAIPPALRPGKFRPPDRLIASLRGLPIMRSESRRPRRGAGQSSA